MAVSKHQIINYYDSCEIDYKLAWNLNKSFSMHYGFWDKTTKNLHQALMRENEILAKIAKIGKMDRVLDAGCGVGGSSIWLAKNIGCQVVGITLSQKQVDTAYKNAKKVVVSHLVNFLKKDFTKTGFADGSFDVVWAIESVCHAQDKSKFIKEAYRILKKGGRLILADGFCSKRNYNNEEDRIMKHGLNGWGIDFLETLANFRKYLQDAGFKRISSKNVTSNVMLSSKRLYLASFPAFLVTKVGEWLGLRSKIQTANVISAYYQYHALRRKLAMYGIFYAVK